MIAVSTFRGVQSWRAFRRAPVGTPVRIAGGGQLIAYAVTVFVLLVCIGVEILLIDAHPRGDLTRSEARRFLVAVMLVAVAQVIVEEVVRRRMRILATEPDDTGREADVLRIVPKDEED